MLRLWVLCLVFTIWTPAECSDKRFLLNNEVCYGELGCYNTKSPFWSLQRPITFLPETPEKINIRFFLFTRENPDVAIELKHTDVVAGDFGLYKAGLPTKIVIHGFMEAYNLQTWMRDMRSAFLRKAPMNVILVNWSSGNKFPYTQACANAQVAGAEVARLVSRLSEHAGLSPSDVHILGHSLGAHVAGYAGKRARSLFNMVIGRITGLDAAEPYFQYTDPVVRLDKSDATLVDVLHTDGSSILNLGLGLIQPVGHLDFYPNGGSDQPGCNKNMGKITGSIMGVLALDYESIYNAMGCSHVRAIDFYTESIEATTCNFMAFPCANYDDFKAGKCTTCTGGSCPQMGHNADQLRGAPGSYFLLTGPSKPLCSYHYTIAFATGPTVIGKGTVFLKIIGASGSIDSFRYNSDDIQFKPSSSYAITVESSKNIGDIQSVIVTFQKTTSLLTGWIYSDNVRIDSVSVIRGEIQQQTNLCPSYPIIQSGGSATYYVDYC